MTTTQSAAAWAIVRNFLVCLGLAWCLALVEAKTFEIPAAPERMLWDKNGVFDRAPEKKAELERALVAFRERHNYHVYVLVIDNSISFDIGESLMATCQRWLEDKDGLLLCVDLDTFLLYLEEIPMTWDEVSGAAKTPRLLREMPAVIRPACVHLGEIAYAGNINGVPLVEHYTLGMLDVIENTFRQAPAAGVSWPKIAGLLVALLLFGLLLFWWIEQLKARHADKRRREDACIYKFPRVTLPIRLGGVGGALCRGRQYAHGDGRGPGHRDTVRAIHLADSADHSA